MKKSAVFLILSFVLLGFFACQLAIPKAIEIIGTPSARFAEEVAVGKMFVDLLKDAISEKDDLTMIPCTNEKIDIVTYLIHATLLDQLFDMEDPDNPKLPPDLGGDFNESHIGVMLHEDKTLIDGTNPKDYMVIPFSELGSFLPGFKFYHGGSVNKKGEEDKDGIYETKLYFSGSKILDDAKLEIEIFEINVDDDGNITYEEPALFSEKDVPVSDDESDFKKWKVGEETDGYEYKYDGESCPSGGFPIDVEMNGKDLAVSYRVYFSAGTTVPLDHFQDGNIKVEVVVWLPFKFIAIDENAALSFPPGSFFSSEDDLFGREEPDSDSLIADIIESISVDVKFHNNPFMGADLIISSNGGIEIHNLIENEWLSFTITDDNMKVINDPDNWPFIPEIQIRYAEGQTLAFPNVFNAIEFAFKAKVRYRIDL